MLRGAVSVRDVCEDDTLVHTSYDRRLVVTHESACTATDLREYVTIVCTILDTYADSIGNRTSDEADVELMVGASSTDIRERIIVKM